MLLAAGAIGTALTNEDALQFGPTSLAALAPYDIISMLVRDGLGCAIPFFLGRALHADARSLRSLLTLFAVAGLIYIPFIVVELLLSPQLHFWVYGYYQHTFAQTLRGGGFRPMVFMSHGISMTMMMAGAAISAATLARADKRALGGFAGVAALVLFVVVLLCKSTGAALYALVALPLVAFTSSKVQMRVAAALCMLTLLYPALRATDLFPTRALLSVATAFSGDRAQSLEFRFQNESEMLARAEERPLFGWGGFGRARIFDPESGRDLSTTDGYWIIQLGDRGVLGIIATLGLLTAPLLFAGRRAWRLPEVADRRLLAGVALLLAVQVVDLLPNGFTSNALWYVAGALAGALPARRQGAPAADPDQLQTSLRGGVPG